MSLRTSLFDLDDHYKRMYKEALGYSKYKSKNNLKDSYRTNLITSTYKNKTYENINGYLKNKLITLPKLKEQANFNNKQIFKKYQTLDELNRVTVEEFIESIYVGNINNETNTRDIQIKWNFN